MRSPARPSVVAVLVATCFTLVLALAAGVAPSRAADPLPRVMLGTEPLYSGPVVGYHYTAQSDTSTGSWPAGSTLHYQWFQGDKQATPDSFVAIQGATGQRYTMSAGDHWHRIKVRVQATQGGTVVAEKFSAPSNFILWQMEPPALTGRPLVGQVLKATLGSWTSDWDVEPIWRRGRVGTSEMKDIAGIRGLTYRARPADVGKPISLLVMARHQFPEPNATLAIDRRWSGLPKVNGAVPPVRWATKGVLKGVSRKKGQLRLTAIAYAWSDTYRANQSKVTGTVRVYDGTRLVGRYKVVGGRRVITIKGLKRGVHKIRMVFVQNNSYAASSATRSFRVR